MALRDKPVDMTQLMQGKRGLIMGVANDHSIAWAITEKLHAEGAEMGFTHLPDKDPERPRMERRVRKLVEPLGAKLILPCDVTKDEDLDRIFAAGQPSRITCPDDCSS